MRALACVQVSRLMYERERVQYQGVREKRIERNNNGRNVQERLGENKDVWVLEARGEGGGYGCGGLGAGGVAECDGWWLLGVWAG